MYRLQWSWDLNDVSLLERCPHFRGCYVWAYNLHVFQLLMPKLVATSMACLVTGGTGKGEQESSSAIEDGGEDVGQVCAAGDTAQDAAGDCGWGEGGWQGIDIPTGAHQRGRQWCAGSEKGDNPATHFVS